MKEFARRIAVVVGAAALSFGLIGATAGAADAAPAKKGNIHKVVLKDSSWPC